MTTHPIGQAMTDLIALATKHGAFLNEGGHGIPAGTLITFEPAELEAFAAALAARPVIPASAPEALSDEQNLDALMFGANVAETLLAIGRAIGFGRVQQIAGEQWEAEHNCAPRGQMGVTVGKCIPPKLWNKRGQDAYRRGWTECEAALAAPSTPAAADCRLPDGRCGICGGDWSVCGCDGMLKRSAQERAPSTPAAEHEHEWKYYPVSQCEACIHCSVIRPAATQAQASDWQKRAVEAGFQYVRASDDHWVECTQEQAVSLLIDVLDIRVEIAAPHASAPEALNDPCKLCGGPCFNVCNLLACKYLEASAPEALPAKCSKCAAHDDGDSWCFSWGSHCPRRAALAAPTPGAPEALSEPDYKALYDELLFAVARKHHNQTRHQTALMYIQNAERGTDERAAAAPDHIAADLSDAAIDEALEAWFANGPVGIEHKTDRTRMRAAIAALAAPSTPAAKPEPTFVNVFCSQCGRDFGPGEHGFSHCRNHAGKASK